MLHLNCFQCQILKKIEFLTYIPRIITHYLKTAKVEIKIPPNIIYHQKKSWKGESEVSANARMQGNYFIKKLSIKDVESVHTVQAFSVQFVKLHYV